MGKYIDFAVPYNTKTDTWEDITKRIFYSIFIRRLKANKPIVIFIGGDSGEGKSTAGLKIQEILMELQGMKLLDFVDDINVYTPIQYPQKIDKLLYYDKDKCKTLKEYQDIKRKYKKVNILCVHEAREVVNSKDWNNFLTRSIADINAMSRSVKRLCIIIVSQFIRDIATDIRYTLNFYCTVKRPNFGKAKMYIYKMWKDDRDIDKPKLRRRKLKGYLIVDGKYKKFSPPYVEITLPDKAVQEHFEKSDKEAKAGIIRAKLDKLIKEMQMDMDSGSKKINAMVDWYTKNVESLKIIGKRSRGKWKLKDSVKDMHDLTRQEYNEFQIRLNDKLKTMGLIQK